MNKLRYQVEWLLVRFTPLMCATVAILGLVGIETLFIKSRILGDIIAALYALIVTYWIIRLYDFIIKDLKRIEDKISKARNGK